MKIKVKDIMCFTKFNIVMLSYFSALIGYLFSHETFSEFSVSNFLLFSIGFILLAAGSCALNQVQEVELDASMRRTSHRPIPAGKISWIFGFRLSLALLCLGLFFLSVVSVKASLLGMATVFMYNGLYTMWFKPKLAFAAIPGAIPGAMPVVIGYCAYEGASLFSADIVYLFLIMFLWQMPHFWALALRYREDYKKGGVPVLPIKFGDHFTKYQIGLYMFVYLSLAVLSPLFVQTRFFYLVLVIPCVLLMLLEFFRFFQSDVSSYWFKFFMKVNLSLLVFLVVPLLDKILGNILRSYQLF